MRIAIVGGGPGGLYFAILLSASTRPRRRRLRAQRAGRHVRLRRRLLRRDARGRSRPPTRRRSPRSAPLRPLGRDRHPLPGRGRDLRRARLLGAQPPGPAQHPAAARRRARRRAALPRRGRPTLRRRPVVGADGVNSTVRARHAEHFRPSLDQRRAKYMWLGTDLVFDAFKFFIAETEHGVFQVHGYPYGDTMSTFIVETTEETWRRGARPRRLRGPRRPPPDRQPLALDQLRHRPQRGLAPRERRAARRRRAHRALLDRLRHEARDGGRDRARVGRRAAGRPCDRLRGRAPADRREHAARRAGQPRVVRGHRALHGPGRRCCSPSTCSRAAGASPTASCSCATRGSCGRRGQRLRRPPMFTPFRLRELELANRVVVSPMDMYSSLRRHARRLPPRAPRRARRSAAPGW